MYLIKKSLIEVIDECSKFESTIKSKLLNRIQNRFTYFIDETKTYLIEDYIENEWRDSFDLYYSKTQYNCNSFVKRVHFISDDI